MRYTDPKLIDALAGEYVLGTLSGAARRRFERLLGSSLPARRAVADWEQRFVPLALALRPRVPRRELWTAIESRLGLGTARTPRGGAGWWPALAAGLAAIAIAFGSLYSLRTPQLIEPTHISVVADESAAALWLLQSYPQREELRIRTVGSPPPRPGQSYELWMLPDDGSAPVSLGILPGSGSTVRRLAAQQSAVLARTSTLAVSVEPAGGSPTGAPTGPVVFTAALIRS